MPALGVIDALEASVDVGSSAPVAGTAMTTAAIAPHVSNKRERNAMFLLRALRLMGSASSAG